MHQILLKKINVIFKRYLTDQINWDSQLIGIKRSKGVGKSTMILQHIKGKYGSSEEALYICMDMLAVKPYSLFEIAEYHAN